MHQRVSFTVRSEAQRKIAAENLKCCPLCGSVNALTNHECYLCSWHGRFDNDPILIESALEQLIDRCPELADVMCFSSDTPQPWFRRIFQRLQVFFIKRRLDVKA